jgi:ABC-type lipoprotein export system ATPase subunit
MLIELQHITRQYGENPKPVLDNISIKVNEGSTVAVVGPSGSGKSTLLNLLGTLDFPDSGTVLFDGISTSSLNSDELAAMRNRQIGFVFQTHLLMPQLTAIENILLPVLPQGRDRQRSASVRAGQMLEMVALADKRDRYPGQMSVGECQRIAVVRALINEPALILADEPTGSLDHESAERLGDMLIELKRAYSFTLVTVTHSVELAGRMEVLYRLLNGKLIAN